MKCPNCHAKIKCFLTSRIDDSTIYREYVCILCEERFMSTEHLEKKNEKGVPKFVRRYYNERI